RDLENLLGGDESGGLTKKEMLNLTRQRDKLDLALGGIKEMGGRPDMLVVIDTNKEEIAISEAKKLGIPIAAVVDSNSNPNHIDFPIPGNDDAMRAIQLYCDLFAGAVLDGLQQEMTISGVDVGEAVAPPPETLADVAIDTPAAPEAVAAEVVTDVVAPVEAAPVEAAAVEVSAEAATPAPDAT
ncbi:MAG: small subunit ribosomal protein S2, partial [Alphaproteobacteria bacterium]